MENVGSRYSLLIYKMEEHDFTHYSCHAGTHLRTSKNCRCTFFLLELSAWNFFILDTESGLQNVWSKLFCPKIYHKSVLHLRKPQIYTEADTLQICGKFWDIQYLSAQEGDNVHTYITQKKLPYSIF